MAVPKRQAAVKANEALHQGALAGRHKSNGRKRKGSSGGAESIEAKREKKPKGESPDEPSPSGESPEQPPTEASKLEKVQDESGATTGENDQQKDEKGTGEAKEEDKDGSITGDKQEAGASQGAAANKSRGEKETPSIVLEKGLIYFFFRSRVNVEGAESLDDVARSFIVMRPLPADEALGKGPIKEDSNCRLLVLPKKKLPTSPRERYMGFVEKAGVSLKTIKESFLGTEYETKTKGLQEVPSATPLAEGVYTIVSTAQTSHLAYILTIPEEPSEIQTDFGIQKRGSFIVSSKNPKFPGPSGAHLPKGPEYPQKILQDFRDYRWVPLEPKFIDYPNAQVLLIGARHQKPESSDITKETQNKKQDTGEELEQLEHENEIRASPLQDDHMVFEDLGMSSKHFSSMPTTWD